MSAERTPSYPAAHAGERRVPQLGADMCALASLVLAFLTIGTMAAYLPGRAPAAMTVSLVAASAGMLLLAAAMVRRAGAWLPRDVFRRVAVPTLVVSGIAVSYAELVFVYDGTRGLPLAVITAALVLVALDLPVVLGYGVARSQLFE